MIFSVFAFWLSRFEYTPITDRLEDVFYVFVRITVLKPLPSWNSNHSEDFRRYNNQAHTNDSPVPRARNPQCLALYFPSAVKTKTSQPNAVHRIS